MQVTDCKQNAVDGCGGNTFAGKCFAVLGRRPCGLDCVSLALCDFDTIEFV